jgi:hypothetical protein
MTLTGKGYYIWKVRYAENGDPERIAALTHESNLSHVLIKIADGAFPYNIDLERGYDYARPVIKKLQANNVQVLGWQYIYGNYPEQEAEIAVARALELGVDGFVVNAEIEYETRTKAPAASRYMSILRNNLGSLPLALSSFRYPRYHPSFPWVNFLDRCDYNMPQIYWIKAHNNAGEQLQRSVNEFKQIHPFRPIIPTGPTFKQDGWIPTQKEVLEFIRVAKELNLPAINFWYWEGCRKYMPEFWNLVRDAQYERTVQQASLPERFVNALNKPNLDELLDLYTENAVLIRSMAAVRGRESIGNWLASLIGENPKIAFSLISQSQHGKIVNFQWQGLNGNQTQIEGHDTMGVKDDRIVYHYSFQKHL